MSDPLRSSSEDFAPSERQEIINALNEAATFIGTDGVRIGFRRAQNIASKLTGLGVWLERRASREPGHEDAPIAWAVEDHGTLVGVRLNRDEAERASAAWFGTKVVELFARKP